MKLRAFWEVKKKHLALLRSFTKTVSRRQLLTRIPAYYALSALGRVPRYPLFIAYYVTPRCNLRCVMCNQRVFNENPSGEDHADDFLRFLDSLPDRRFSLFFSGGEPFIHPQLLRFIAKGKQKGYVVGLVTNGTLCTPPVIDELVRLRLDHIFFTLHGNRETHSRITGSDECFDRTTEAIRYYTSHNRCRTFVVLNAAITPMNYTSLEEIIDIGKALGVSLVRFENLNVITPEEAERNREMIARRFEGVPFVMNENISGEILGDIAARVQRIMETRYPVPVAVKPPLGRAALAAWYSRSFPAGKGCDTIRHTLCISEDGTCTACNFQRLQVGNCFSEGIDAVWRGGVFTRFRAVVADRRLPGCARCCRL